MRTVLNCHCGGFSYCRAYWGAHAVCCRKHAIPVVLQWILHEAGWIRAWAISVCRNEIILMLDLHYKFRASRRVDDRDSCDMSPSLVRRRKRISTRKFVVRSDCPSRASSIVLDINHCSCRDGSRDYIFLPSIYSFPGSRLTIGSTSSIIDLSKSYQQC